MSSWAYPKTSKKEKISDHSHREPSFLRDLKIECLAPTDIARTLAVATNSINIDRWIYLLPTNHSRHFLHIPLYKTITTLLFLHLIIAARKSQLARFPQFPSSSSVYSLNLDLFLTDKINWGFSRCFDLDSVESLLFQSGREFDEVSLIHFFLCFIFLPISISISCNRLSLFLS